MRKVFLSFPQPLAPLWCVDRWRAQCGLSRELWGRPHSPWVPEAEGPPPVTTFLLSRAKASARSYSDHGDESVPSNACGEDFVGSWRSCACTGEGQRVSGLYCKTGSCFYDDKTSVASKFGLSRPPSLGSLGHVHTGRGLAFYFIYF